MKDKRQEALFRLPPKRIHGILDDLRNLRSRANNGEEIDIPPITLLLRNGHEITGLFIGLEQDKNESCLLLQMRNKERFEATYDIAYLNVNSIDALIIHNAVEIAHLISSGAIPVPLGESRFSILELKRKAKNYACKTSEAVGREIVFDINWEEVPRTEEDLYFLAEALGMVNGILADLAGEDLAGEAIRSSISKIVFDRGAGAEVSLENGVMKITIPITGRLTRESLRSKIEELL